MPSHNHAPEGDGDPYFHCWIPGGAGTSDGITSGNGLGVRKNTSSTGGGAAHTHGLTTSNKSTSSVGSASPITIEPKSVAFYVWKRTA